MTVIKTAIKIQPTECKLYFLSRFLPIFSFILPLLNASGQWKA